MDGSPYAEEYHTMISRLDANERRGLSAAAVAATILEAIDAEPPRSFYAVGSNAPLVFALRRLMPRPVVERMVHRRHGLR
jgi:hypothetical protein